MLWECASAECDQADGARLLKNYLITAAHSVDNQLLTFNFPKDCRYFVGRIPSAANGAGDTYVSVFTDIETCNMGPNQNRTMALVDVATSTEPR